jgi:methionyl-tRNA formyltransferase
MGPPLLLDVLDNIHSRLEQATAQDDRQANYAHKMSKAEARIDWSLGAHELDCRIRAFNPFPVCFSTLSGERVRIWQARPVEASPSPGAPGTIVTTGEEGIVVCCKEGHLAIEVLQLPGGKPLATQQVLSARAEQFAPGKRFDAAAEASD